MNKDIFLTTCNPYHSKKDEWLKSAFYNSIIPQEIADIVYKKEENAIYIAERKRDMVMKFNKCITCAHRDNAWRCGLCRGGEMYVPVEHKITAEYHHIGRRNGKTKEAKEHLRMFYGVYTIPQIKDVIFNDPATIVFWEDGTKTVVKTMEGDKFDPHTGLAQAISKKALSDNYKKEFKKWTKPYYKKKAEEKIADLEVKTGLLKMQTAFDEAISTIAKTFCKDDAE